MALLLVPLWVGPVAAKGFPWKDNLITTHGSLVISLAKDGNTQWQATFGESGSLAIYPDSKAPWLASGGQLWAFDPAQGKAQWEFKPDGTAMARPQAIPAAWIVAWKGKSEWSVAALDKSDGRKLWSQNFSAKPAFLNEDGQTPLVVDADQQLLAWGNEPTRPLWERKLPHEKSWLTKDKLLLLDHGLFTCLSRDTGKILWTYTSAPFEVPAQPVAINPIPCGIEVATGPQLAIQVQDMQKHLLTCLDWDTGKILWQKSAFPSLRTHISWAGPHLVHRLLETVESLALADGSVEYRLHLNTYTTDTFWWKNRVLVLGRAAFPQPLIDINGRRGSATEIVDSFVAFIDGMLYARDGRSPCAMEVLKDNLVFSTRSKPERKPGETPDPKAPEPPLIMHGASSPDANPWIWAPTKPSEEAKWKTVEGRLMLFHEDGSLSELDPASGKISWHSAPLVKGDGLFDLAFADDGLWVENKKGRFYFLDSQGKMLAQWNLKPFFNREKQLHLLCLLLLTAAFGYYIGVARRRKLFIRKIAGLEAIDEAVGRATEMGRPILYIPGLEDIDVIQTLASLSILAHVARKTADYETDILVPTRKAVVMTTAQEVVREAYTLAGRPDAFVAENIRYLTDDQFGFVAGVDGIMLREKPAANFYMGMFYGESLILTETGFNTGAIQIAGTAAPSQLPFFVATCDYTLMGEELFAASAYLSQDPLQVGSLRGQDVGKAFIMAAIMAGTLMASLGISLGAAL